MARGNSTFRQRDVTKALKAAEKAGVRACVEIDRQTGNIRIVPIGPETRQAVPAEGQGAGVSEWDNI